MLIAETKFHPKAIKWSVENLIFCVFICQKVRPSRNSIIPPPASPGESEVHLGEKSLNLNSTPERRNASHKNLQILSYRKRIMHIKCTFYLSFREKTKGHYYFLVINCLCIKILFPIVHVQINICVCLHFQMLW